MSMACPKCGTHNSMLAMGMKWFVSPQDNPREICPHCHAHKSKWPSSWTDPTEVRATLQGNTRLQESLSGRHDQQAVATPHPRCGHLCKGYQGPYSAGCCICAGASSSCSVHAIEAAAKSTASLSGAAAAAMLVKVAMQDVMGNRFEVAPGVAKDHTRRVAEGESKLLFHQTSADAASAILASKSMRKGSAGTLGGGIYFAGSPQETQRKAHQHGHVLAVFVKLGHMKKVTRSDPRTPQLTLEALLAAGYDSVYCDEFQSGPEWVVYDEVQVSPHAVVVEDGRDVRPTCAFGVRCHRRPGSEHFHLNKHPGHPHHVNVV